MLKINKVYHGDCLEGIKRIDNNSIDSIVTDPPYELGFMGKSWDSTGIAYDINLWKQAIRVLKPGGYLLSFGGSRTYHRMACAIEDAGFEIRDMVEWIYGSGFPKSLNIEKAINKMDGIKFEEKPAEGVGFMKPDSKDWHVTKHQLIQNEQSSERASIWQGWGTALKPAHEPICMARKPLSEKTVAENVLKWGTAGINIDKCRVEMQDGDKKVGGFGNGEIGFGGGNAKGVEWQEKTTGRFPANLIHDGSDEVMGEFAKYGVSKSGKSGVRTSDGFNDSIYGKGVGIKAGQDNGEFGDSGTPARFFYCAKASKSERNMGCEGLEEKQTWSSQEKRESNSFDVFESDGRPKTVNTNNHPTVKPLALMRYLCKLITPKNGLVLDPYAGSGSTLIAAMQEGFNFIGIDNNKEYCEITCARLNYHSKKINLSKKQHSLRQISI